MGAEEFKVRAKGDTAEEAFKDAVKQAVHAHGHAGYTGTIAEKLEFVMADVPENVDSVEYVNKLMEKGDRRYMEKWGPCGVVRLGQDMWLFFGLASR